MKWNIYYMFTLLFFHKHTVDVVPILNDFHRERLQELPQVENVYALFRFKAQQIRSQDKTYDPVFQPSEFNLCS